MTRYMIVTRYTLSILSRSLVGLATLLVLATATQAQDTATQAQDAAAKAQDTATQVQDTVDYARDIQPLFARHCYKCHGPDDDQGGLRLDTRDAALAELESGLHAIVPGEPDGGELLYRLIDTDESVRMPPEGERMSQEDIELVKRWIQQGAQWSEHWAFRPLQPPTVPNLDTNPWVKSPIDAFVLQRLNTAGLKPAPPADKLALLRRAYYDLIGLPPTTEQVDAFLNDDSPDAFEKVIDQLLATEQYGEKWARHWLDIVRYAETNGYERDSRKELIWKYRDYVIRSFNSDKPYDQFVIEQLAGDELPEADPDDVIATGFYRLGIWDDEPADRELARYDYLDDILRTTGEGFLGITIGCARCHDHKIDPLTQKDYYGMLAFFSDVSDHGSGSKNHVPVPTAADRDAFAQRVARKEAQESQWAQQIDQLQQQLIDRLKADKPDALNGLDKGAQPQRVLVADSIKEGTTWRITQTQPADHWFDIAFDDDAQWQQAPGGFGREGTPGGVIRTPWHSQNIWMRTYFRLDEIPEQLSLKIHHDEDVEVYLNGKKIADLDGYGVEYKELDVSQQAKDVLQTGRNTLAVHCRNTGGGQYIDLGLFQPGRDPLELLFAEHGTDTLGAEAVTKWYSLRQQLAKSQATELKFTPEYAMAVSEQGPRKTWILQRGLPAAKGDEVEPLFPEILDPPAPDIESPADKASAGKRLALARWIVSPENRLTSRVIANRVWQHHFGRGLARSTSDFGYQGTPPTHPDLLDWLALNLMENDWKLKAFHKSIMMSSTYQMSSVGDPKALAMDPTNDLLWRFDMRRLTAEELRDSILSVVGSLNPKMYGPPVYSPVSQEVLATASRPDGAWGKSSPEEASRRTIYVHVKRSLRPPLLANFDAPDTDTSCAVRLVTTVPTQALGLLNSEFMMDQAKQLADRLKTQAGDKPEDQIALGIRLVSGRVAEADEVAEDIAFLEALQSEEGMNPDTALATYCLMLLNTNEFVYLD